MDFMSRKIVLKNFYFSLDTIYLVLYDKIKFNKHYIQKGFDLIHEMSQLWQSRRQSS